MDRKEAEFFEWFKGVEQIMHNYNVEDPSDVVNVREVWNIAYKYGKIAGLDEAKEIIENAKV